jgi:hypothetical protein
MLANIPLGFASKVSSNLQKSFEIPHLMKIRNDIVCKHFLSNVGMFAKSRGRDKLPGAIQNILEVLKIFYIFIYCSSFMSA